MIMNVDFLVPTNQPLDLSVRMMILQALIINKFSPRIKAVFLLNVYDFYAKQRGVDALKELEKNKFILIGFADHRTRSIKSILKK